MRRTPVRTATVLATVAVAFAGVGCTSAEGPDPTTETTEPVPLEFGEEQGETLAPQNPNEADNGTDG